MNYKTFDEQYIEICNEIISTGVRIQGRNNLVYTQKFGQDVIVDLRLEFPILSLRKMPIKNLLREFLWDLHGKSDIESLGKARHFWDFLATPDGYLPHSYGNSWRSWPVNEPETIGEIIHNVFHSERFDQLEYIVEQLKTNPSNRQLVLQTYNPAYVKSIAPIPPCHPTVIFSSDKIHLDCLVVARLV